MKLLSKYLTEKKKKGNKKSEDDRDLIQFHVMMAFSSVGIGSVIALATCSYLGGTALKRTNMAIIRPAIYMAVNTQKM